MRSIVIGLGVQGRKRRQVAGPDCVATIDPVNPEADLRDLSEIAPDRFDAALLCTPDEPKPALIEKLVGLGKHVLVEKPLAADDAVLARLEQLARSNGAVLYTAYNHRFEPHFARMAEVVRSGELGRLYRCRLFYGNGTARLVRESAWRDQGSGVLADLGSHLLDTLRFWFGIAPEDWTIVACDRFENRAPDSVVLAAPGASPRIELEMTLLSWRNSFTCDLFAEKGSVHLRSLCKWGPAEFIRRTRILPSGRPPEETVTLVQDDPTWLAEYRHFQKLCADRVPTDLSTDRWIGRVLGRLDAQIGTTK